MVSREDKQIEESLLRGTEESIELKDRVWENIEGRLNFSERKVISMKQKRRGVLKYSAIAAAIAIVFLANTSYGSAAVDQVKKLFAPKKTVEQQLEGNEEKTEMDLKTSTMKYVIYIDSQMYKMESLDGRDVIKPINPALNLPEVSMTIEQVADKKPEVVVAEMEKSLKGEYETVENKGKVTDPVNAILVKGRSGKGSNAKIANYYFIDNTKGGTFIVTQKYFLEAEEGHGARFYHMLKEFRIVSE